MALAKRTTLALAEGTKRSFGQSFALSPVSLTKIAI